MRVKVRVSVGVKVGVMVTVIICEQCLLALANLLRARVPAPKLAAPAVTGRSKCEAAEPSLDSGGRGNAGELAQPCAAAYAVQPLAKQGGILERLPKGFDQRSREAFRAAADSSLMCAFDA